MHYPVYQPLVFWHSFDEYEFNYESGSNYEMIPGWDPYQAPAPVVRKAFCQDS